MSEGLTYTYNPRTWEEEAGRSESQVQPQLNNRFKASMPYTRPALKKKKKYKSLSFLQEKHANSQAGTHLSPCHPVKLIKISCCRQAPTGWRVPREMCSLYHSMSPFGEGWWCWETEGRHPAQAPRSFKVQGTEGKVRNDESHFNIMGEPVAKRLYQSWMSVYLTKSV